MSIFELFTTPFGCHQKEEPMVKKAEANMQQANTKQATTVQTARTFLDDEIDLLLQAKNERLLIEQRIEEHVRNITFLRSSPIAEVVLGQIEKRRREAEVAAMANAPYAPDVEPPDFEPPTRTRRGRE